LRYAHVDRKELFEAAGRLEELAGATDERPASPAPEVPSANARMDQPSPSGNVSSESERPHGRRRRRRRRRRR
jgi:hypothetical protein